MTELKKLTFEEARAVAEKAARKYVDGFWPKNGPEILDDCFIRAKNFWIFFINKAVILPPEAWLQRQFSAYDVGDYGSTSFMRDLRNQPEKLQEALEGRSIAHEEYRSRKQKELDEAERGLDGTAE